MSRKFRLGFVMNYIESGSNHIFYVEKIEVKQGKNFCQINKFYFTEYPYKVLIFDNEAEVETWIRKCVEAGHPECTMEGVDLVFSSEKHNIDR